jgi:hypothetical protein
VRRALPVLAGVAVAALGALALSAFLTSRDDAALEPRADLGRPYRGEPVLSPFLQAAVERGNVVVLHRDARTPAGTRKLAAAAPRTLQAEGLAVLFEREPTLETALAAVARRRILLADDPRALARFVDHHLGRPPGAGR